MLAAQLGAVGGWWPLLPAALAGAVFAWCDGRNGAREAAAELAGAVAFALLPAAFGALAGWSLVASLALAAMMLVRSVPTVLTVRASIRIRKGQDEFHHPGLVTTGAGIFLTVWLAALRLDAMGGVGVRLGLRGANILAAARAASADSSNPRHHRGGAGRAHGVGLVICLEKRGRLVMPFPSIIRRLSAMKAVLFFGQKKRNN